MCMKHAYVFNLIQHAFIILHQIFNVFCIYFTLFIPLTTIPWFELTWGQYSDIGTNRTKRHAQKGSEVTNRVIHRQPRGSLHGREWHQKFIKSQNEQWPACGVLHSRDLTVYGEFSEIEYHQINHGQTMEHSTTMVPIDSISKTLFFLNFNYKKRPRRISRSIME